MPRIDKIALFLVVLVALLFRLSILIPLLSDPERSIHNDTESYLAVAKNIVAGNGYTHCKEAPYWPDVARTPIYPFFLALIIFVFGESLTKIIAAQLLLDLLTTAIIYITGVKFFGKKEGRNAGLFYAITMISVSMTGLLLSETLFTFLIALLLYFLLTYERSKKVKVAGFIGGIWGLATLCRPVALFAFPLIFLVIYLVSIKNRKAQLKGISLFLFMSLFLVSPWFYRNYQITGYWTISSVVDYGLLTYNAANLKAYEQGILASEVRTQFEKEVKEKTGKRLWECEDGYEYIGLYREKGRTIIWSNPVKYVFVHMRSTLNNLLPAATEVLQIWGLTKGGKGTLGVINKEGWSAGIRHYFGPDIRYLYLLFPWVLLWGLLLCSAMVGSFFLFQKKEWRRLIALVGLASFFMIISGPSSCPRFSAPAIPCLALLAGYGISNLKKIRKARYSSNAA